MMNVVRLVILLVVTGWTAGKVWLALSHGRL